jgi:FkbM family methyltransferase
LSKLSLGHYAKNLKLLERNTEWWRAGAIGNRQKTTYYGHIFVSYISGAKQIKYLGRNFFFDNPATPLNLQNYPYELTRKVLDNMYISPKTILDVGANIGQFSITANYVLKGEVKIDAFEPNPYVFDFLTKNVSEISSHVKIHNYGVGDKDEQVEIYFDPRRSGIGSLIKQNAGIGASESATIIVTARLEKITKRMNYDLVKIDVEGYEFHALDGLRNIKAKYLFIEISGVGREKDYEHSEILNKIREIWGEYDICYMGSYKKGDDTFDLLVKFSK